MSVFIHLRYILSHVGCI